MFRLLAQTGVCATISYGAGTYFIEVAADGEGIAQLWHEVRGDESVNVLDLWLRR
jgi:hypothetical protein